MHHQRPSVASAWNLGGKEGGEEDTATSKCHRRCSYPKPKTVPTQAGRFSLPRTLYERYPQVPNEKGTRGRKAKRCMRNPTYTNPAHVSGLTFTRSPVKYLTIKGIRGTGGGSLQNVGAGAPTPQDRSTNKIRSRQETHNNRAKSSVINALVFMAHIDLPGFADVDGHYVGIVWLHLGGLGTSGTDYQYVGGGRRCIQSAS